MYTHISITYFDGKFTVTRKYPLEQLRLFNDYLQDVIKRYNCNYVLTLEEEGEHNKAEIYIYNTDNNYVNALKENLKSLGLWKYIGLPRKQENINEYTETKT